MNPATITSLRSRFAPRAQVLIRPRSHMTARPRRSIRSRTWRPTLTTRSPSPHPWRTVRTTSSGPPKLLPLRRPHCSRTSSTRPSPTSAPVRPVVLPTSPRPATERSRANSWRRIPGDQLAQRLGREPLVAAGRQCRGRRRVRHPRPGLHRTSGFFASGRSLEFVANFSDPNQHIGFANDFNSGQWAIFSTWASGGQLYARSKVRAESIPPLERAISTGRTDSASSGPQHRFAT